MPEVDQRCEYRQIADELGGRARAQPFALPVAPVANPVNRGDRADDEHLTERPDAEIGVQYVAAVIPAERQRQNRE